MRLGCRATDRTRSRSGADASRPSDANGAIVRTNRSNSHGAAASEPGREALRPARERLEAVTIAAAPLGASRTRGKGCFPRGTASGTFRPARSRADDA